MTRPICLSTVSNGWSTTTSSSGKQPRTRAMYSFCTLPSRNSSARWCDAGPDSARIMRPEVSLSRRLTAAQCQLKGTVPTALTIGLDPIVFFQDLEQRVLVVSASSVDGLGGVSCGSVFELTRLPGLDTTRNLRSSSMCSTRTGSLLTGGS